MTFEREELAELKKIYFDYYHRELTDEEAMALGKRLVSLFEIVARPLAKLDFRETRDNILNKHG